MGMSLGAGGGGGRRGRRRTGGMPISEINITPMVDVMLVLLIIFMVAAPLMTAGVPIDLPKTQAREMASDTRPVTITVTQTGELSIDREPVTFETVVAAVTAQASEGTDTRVYLRGDAAADYGAIMKVMGALSAAGFGKIGLITTPGEAP